MNYFVTGTDTAVGKTLISCALLHHFAARGLRVAGFKPVAAGSDGDGVNEDARALLVAGTVALSYQQINPCALRAPIAPHIAAQYEQKRIELSPLVAAYHALAAQADMVSVEGVGGLLVPLNATQDCADLIHALDLPVILVVGMRLGCLNHALLTVAALAARGLRLAGWVANVLDKDMLMLEDNIETLRVRIAAPLLGVVGYRLVPDSTVIRLDINCLDMAR
jgi:dethiobiotin synthetase